jgi:predicted Fe-Mo cluster-binding NifX family protein
MMKTIRLALPTNGNNGMTALISDVFARAPNFTFIDVVDGEINQVRVEENKAFQLKQGAGPIVAKNLREKNVDVVVSSDLGPGAKTLLELNGIRMIKVTPGVRIKDAVNEAIKQLYYLIAQS